MNETQTIKISTVAEEFAAGLEFFRGRAMARAYEVDTLRQRIAELEVQSGGSTDSGVIEPSASASTTTPDTASSSSVAGKNAS